MLEEEYEFREAFVGPCPHVISRSENMDSNCCMLMHLENGIKVSKRNKTKEKKIILVCISFESVYEFQSSPFYSLSNISIAAGHRAGIHCKDLPRKVKTAHQEPRGEERRQETKMKI